MNPRHVSADQSFTQPLRHQRVRAGRHNLEEILAHPSMTWLDLRKALVEKALVEKTLPEKALAEEI
jgi:hypothetical protein